MPRGSRSRKHHSVKRRRHGGGVGAPVNPGSYSSASSYGVAAVGSGNEQYNNVFKQGGPNTGSSNAVMSRDGSWQATKGGSRHRRHTKKAHRSRKSRKGGFWGSVINQAIVPFTLLGLQQRYGRRSRKSRK